MLFADVAIHDFTYLFELSLHISTLTVYGHDITRKTYRPLPVSGMNANVVRSYYPYPYQMAC